MELLVKQFLISIRQQRNPPGQDIRIVSGRRKGLMVVVVVVHAEADLREVILALRAISCFARVAASWAKQDDQHNKFCNEKQRISAGIVHATNDCDIPGDKCQPNCPEQHGHPD